MARIANLLLNKDEMRYTVACYVLHLLLYFGNDLYSTLFNPSANTSYYAHMGGAFCGVFYGGSVLLNIVVTDVELCVIKWGRRLYWSYMFFCIVWFYSQRTNPQGVFDSTGYCAHKLQP